MKKIPYCRHWLDKKDIQAVVKSLQSDWITQGPKVKEFESRLCDYTGAKYAVVVSSGTAALHLACLAAEIGSGDEVMTSPITFVASANCALYTGAKVAFADIDRDSLNVDPAKIQEKITFKTKAIIPVHYSGYPCDMRRIDKIARKNNLIVIEDAAHALGADYEGEKIGSCRYSDMAVFSFHPAKHITTGEGGAVLTNSKSYYRRLLMLRAHGITRDPEQLFKKNKPEWYYEMQYLGYNYRITDIQCALGIRQMEKADYFLRRRRLIAQKYNLVFSKLKEAVLPIRSIPGNSSWHIYVIQVRSNRDKIFNALRNLGIEVNLHYIPVYLQPYYQSSGYKGVHCPNAEGYYRRAITLPLYPKMGDPEVNFVINAVKKSIVRFCR